MNNNRIIVLLKSLKKREFNRFLLYVESPFFNQNLKLIKLARYFGTLYPDFPSNLLKKEVLFKKLYGNDEAYQDQKIHDNLSQLVKLFEGFLIQSRYKRDPMARELDLLTELNERNLDKQFQRVYRRMEERFNNTSNQNPEFFLHHFHLLEAKAEFHDKRQIRGRHHNFSEILTSLKAFYLGSSLQFACEILNRRGIAKVDVEFNKQLIEEIRYQLEEENNPYLNIPNISVYYKILLNILEPEQEQHYEDLKALLSQYASTFSKAEAKDMYAYAQNYCVRNVNKGNTRFYEELFELYEVLLSSDLLTNEFGELPHEHYKNITTLGLMLKKYDWVYNFLEAYKEKLHLSVRENAYHYNLATYYYETKQHPKAMRLLQQVEYTDVYYNVSARATLLKIFFETGEYDSIKYVSQAFQAYLKRNKSIPNLHYNRHSNFISLIRKMARLSAKKYRLEQIDFDRELNKLAQELKEMKEVSFRSWIKSKINEHKASIPAIG